MDSSEADIDGAGNGNGAQETLPPPPPVIPPDIIPVRAGPEQCPEPVKKKVVRVPIARRGPGSKGQKTNLLTNHFKVSVTNVEGHFFHYSVCLYIFLVLHFGFSGRFKLSLFILVFELVCIFQTGFCHL